MLETIHPAQVLTTRQQGQGQQRARGLFAFGDMPWEVGEPKWGYGGRSEGCVINEFTSAPEPAFVQGKARGLKFGCSK